MRFCAVFDLNIDKFHIITAGNEPRDKRCALTMAAAV